jgi:hypothetical protein
MTRTLRAEPAPADITAVRLDRDAEVGIVLGTAAGGQSVAVPFFTAAGATQAAIFGDPALPRLVALRALGAGARLLIVASQPATWQQLRDGACWPAHRMTIVGPDSGWPAEGTRAAPSMVIIDTGDSGSVGREFASTAPWQAFVTVCAARSVPVSMLRGIDVVILHRSSPACRAAVVAALRLPDSMAQSLHGIPDDVVAIASAGLVRFVSLSLHPAERALLTRSER